MASKNEVLFHRPRSAWNDNKGKKEAIYSFCDDYKVFMKHSKTERTCAQNIIKTLERSGFKDISGVKKAKPGDRFYRNFKDKVIIAFIVGKNPNELRIVGSHIDSPRLDLKPSPLYEDCDVALLKSHYYGGIKKYHWVNVPLALHGVVFTSKGKKTISIGEKENEPKFIIPDLLIHLAMKKMEKKASEVVEGEELNILVGNIPFDDKEIKETIKLTVLKHLNDNYGISEKDFKNAELEFVPAGSPMDIGFDGSMVAAYGQDDKVCAYTSMRALLEIKVPDNTAVGLFIDKEETGSMGDTGADSFIMLNTVHDYCKAVGIDDEPHKILERSKSISADVTAAVNPNHKDVHDLQNASFFGRGVSIEKYGGKGGKGMSNDASSEYMNFVISLAEKNSVPWQTGELGKIDIGGGGTIAMFLSRYGMDCLDAGPCVMGMHSPFEVASKLDIYSAYLLYKAFFKA